MIITLMRLKVHRLIELNELIDECMIRARLKYVDLISPFKCFHHDCGELRSLYSDFSNL